MKCHCRPAGVRQGPVQAMRALLLACWALQWLCFTTRGQRSTTVQVFYAVQMEGGVAEARALAQRHGLRFVSRMGSLTGFYTLVDHLGRKRSVEVQVAASPRVKWVQRQQPQYRDRRAAFRRLDPGLSAHSEWAELPRNVYDVINSEDSLADPLQFNDPYWPLQWELFNSGQFGSPKRFDLNVMPVWKKGITGRGVVVTVIDDGVDHTNKDLKKNYEPFASFDLRGVHGLSQGVTPPQDQDSSHGSRCAGEIAMEANNSFCGVGIAFNAKIGGIRLLGGTVVDAMEASALSHNNRFIDIYTCSWGPKDNGQEMAGPELLTETALQLGAQTGRGGKGSIFVWASGNGGLVGDHCGADGYVNSIYSVAIGALSHTGQSVAFSEPCPAVMAGMLTGTGAWQSLPLVTATDMNKGCDAYFAGTSSAAPMAAGVFALVLEAK